MDTVEIIRPLTDERWGVFVAASPDAGIFHHQEWLWLMYRQYGYPIHAHCVVSERGSITAALPVAHVRSRLTGSRMVALPFSDMCGPITLDGNQGLVAPLVASLTRRHRESGTTFEIRESLKGVGHRGHSFYHHQVPLDPDVDVVRRRFTSSTRRGVSKAEREGVEITCESGAAALDAFYRMHVLTRHRQGVPTQPKRFFRRFERLFDLKLGFVLVARHQNVPVAAAVMLAHNGVLTYKYGASLPGHLSVRPNNAIFMEAIRWGSANGCTSFDLGRTDLDNEGLRTFKRSWGAEERTVAYTLLSRRPPDSEGSGVPPAVRSFITRTPPVTGRLIGEVLYRHFA